jgi:AraC-like DNA-binding protein
VNNPAWIDGKHHPEPSVDHPYFTRPGHASRGDEAAPQPDESETDRVQLLREVFTVLETGEPHLMAARLQALKYRWNLSGLSIRDAAEKAGCSRTTLHRITRQMGHLAQR